MIKIIILTVHTINFVSLFTVNMDISDNAFDPQQNAGQQQQQQHQHQHQQTLQQQHQSTPAGLQQMQCDSSSLIDGHSQQFDGTTTTTTTTHQLHHGPLGGPIPLPAPPQHNYDKTPRASDNIDFDSLLLQQFSCLGTRDHEDLIEQFHSLMNNQMNKDAARFFLEMSNW